MSAPVEGRVYAMRGCEDVANRWRWTEGRWQFRGVAGNWGGSLSGDEYWRNGWLVLVPDEATEATPPPSLRDTFAAAALTGILASYVNTTPDKTNLPAVTDAATWAYQYADAMIAARGAR